LTPVELLLIATDDAALREAVVAAGGFNRAIRTLFDRALRLQENDGPQEDVLSMMAVADHVYALAQRTRR
jgi:hypothetical protein